MCIFGTCPIRAFWVEKVRHLQHRVALTLKILQVAIAFDVFNVTYLVTSCRPFEGERRVRTTMEKSEKLHSTAIIFVIFIFGGVLAATAAASSSSLARIIGKNGNSVELECRFGNFCDQ